MSIHRIRLAGPWACQKYEPSTIPDRAERQTCRLPFTLDERVELGGRPTAWALFRHFHKPTGISDTTRVFVAMELQDAEIVLLLNGELLVHELQPLQLPGTGAAMDRVSDGQRMSHREADISSRLAASNELQLQVAQSTPDRPAILRQVWLVIRE